MNKFSLKKIKEKLEIEKKSLEEELQKFAQKDKKLKEDWNVKFPKFDGSLEEKADEIEEYNTWLSIESNLEHRLKDIDLALAKIKKGKYGKCEKCGNPISQERLRVCPEARRCNKCNK